MGHKFNKEKQLKDLLKKDKCINGAFEYMFLDIRNIVGILGKEITEITSTVSIHLDLALEIYESLFSQVWIKRL